MGNLIETVVWEDGIPYFAADAILTGGPDCPDNIPIQALANRTAFLKKRIDDAVSGALTFEYANRLKTSRNIAMSGDGSWSVSFDGSGNVTAVMALNPNIVLPAGATVTTHPATDVSNKPASTSHVLARMQRYGLGTASSQVCADLNDINAVGGVLQLVPETLNNPYGYGTLFTMPRASSDQTMSQVVVTSAGAMWWRFNANGLLGTWYQAASTASVQAAIAALVASSPAALDTLNELAAALGNDPNFATTITNALAGKAALAGSNAQTFSVANAALAQHALPLGQAQGLFAALAGLATQVFNVAAGSQASHAPNLGQFLATMTGNDYLKLPVMVGGVLRTLIVQWCTSGSVAAGASGNVTFPLTFPNACLFGLAAPVGNAGNGNGSNVVIGATSTTGANLYNWGPIAASAKVIVIGW